MRVALYLVCAFACLFVEFACLLACLFSSFAWFRAHAEERRVEDLICCLFERLFFVCVCLFVCLFACLFVWSFVIFVQQTNKQTSKQTNKQFVCRRGKARKVLFVK